ncbi:MAG: hypothetical protein ACLQVD_07875 [Capsulimonadaceae bacterium]
MKKPTADKSGIAERHGSDRRPSLADLLRKVTNGEGLTNDEARIVTRTYRDLRVQYEQVLEDSAEDEVKVLAIRHALEGLEARRLTGPEFVSEIIYSVHILKDKRKRDRMLRSEIAYRMALAAYFYPLVRGVKTMRTRGTATSEFLFQVNCLDHSLRDYRRLKDHAGVRSDDAA